MEDFFDLRSIYSDNVKKLLKKRIVFGEERETKSYFERIAKQTDGRIPKKIGDMLISENNNPDYAILLHRTSNIDKETVFKNGLIIAGGNDIKYTMSGYDGKKISNFNLMLGIRDGCEYKTGGFYGARCLIMKIPITALEYKKGISKPILRQTNNVAEQSGGLAVVKDKYQTVLLPEYILGSIEYDNDKISKFVKNPNYKEVHEYINDGLICTEQLINSYLKQKNIKINKETEKKANETIKVENSEYMKNNRFNQNNKGNNNFWSVKKTQLKDYSKNDIKCKNQNKEDDISR